MKCYRCNRVFIFENISEHGEYTKINGVIIYTKCSGTILSEDENKSEKDSICL